MTNNEHKPECEHGKCIFGSNYFYPCTCHSQPKELPKCGTDGKIMWCYCGKCKPKDYELPKDFPQPSVAEHNPKNEDCHYECKGLCNAAMPFCTCGRMNAFEENLKSMNNGPIPITISNEKYKNQLKEIHRQNPRNPYKERKL